MSIADDIVVPKWKPTPEELERARKTYRERHYDQASSVRAGLQGTVEYYISKACNLPPAQRLRLISAYVLAAQERIQELEKL